MYFFTFSHKPSAKHIVWRLPVKEKRDNLQQKNHSCTIMSICPLGKLWYEGASPIDCFTNPELSHSIFVILENWNGGKHSLVKITILHTILITGDGNIAETKHYTWRMYRRYMMHWKYDLSKIKQRSYQSFDIGRIKSIVKGCLSSFVWIPSFNQIHNISHVNTDHLPKDKKMLGLIMLSSDTQNLSNFIKVSVKPKFDHFSKKIVFRFFR